jgi:hypothetical protein
MFSTRKTMEHSRAACCSLPEAEAAEAAEAAVAAAEAAALEAAEAVVAEAVEAAAAAAEAAALVAVAAEVAVAVAVYRGEAAACARSEYVPITLTDAGPHGRSEQFNPILLLLHCCPFDQMGGGAHDEYH